MKISPALPVLSLLAVCGTAFGQCDSQLLLAPDRQEFDSFGYAVSAKNNWLAIGAHLDDNMRGPSAGSVYVWQKVGQQWQYYSRFQAPTTGYNFFGHAVATDGTTMVISAENDTVFIMERRADGFWYPGGVLPAPPGGYPSSFGFSVDVNGSRIAVGAPNHSPDANRQEMGGVYMYRKVNGVWQFHVSIVNPTFDSSAGDRFGYDVALGSDGALVVGAPGFDWTVGNDTIPGNGACFLFVPSGGSYALPQGGKVSQGWGPGLEVGKSVAIDGQWIAFGVPNAWGYGADNSGSIAVAKREANNSLTYWTSGSPYPAAANEKYGTEVAIAGTHVVGASASGGRVVEFTIPESASAFDLDNGRVIRPQAASGSAYFGTGLALHERDVIVGDARRVAGADGQTGGVTVFAATAQSAADTFDDAPELTLPATVTGCTTFATSNSQNMGADICGSSKESPDVWYKFTADRASRVTALLDGEYDCVLSAHDQEPRGWDSFAIVCNDDLGGGIRDSRIEFDTVPGATYWIRCSGYNGANGGFVLTVSYDCPADFNGDGFLDFFDYDDYVNCFETGTCPPGKTADFTSDAFVDFFDYDAFVQAFEEGC